MCNNTNIGSLFFSYNFFLARIQECFGRKGRQQAKKSNYGKRSLAESEFFLQSLSLLNANIKLYSL